MLNTQWKGSTYFHTFQLESSTFQKINAAVHLLQLFSFSLALCYNDLFCLENMQQGSIFSVLWCVECAYLQEYGRVVLEEACTHKTSKISWFRYVNTASSSNKNLTFLLLTWIKGKNTEVRKTQIYWIIGEVKLDFKCIGSSAYKCNGPFFPLVCTITMPAEINDAPLFSLWHCSDAISHI